MIFLKSVFLITLITFPLFITAQAVQQKYWIQFTDKFNNPYSISNPIGFLSSKSIQRRLKQGIIIVENDLPVTPLYIDSVKSTGVKVINTSKWFNAITIETNDILLLSKVLSFPFVKSVDPVIKIRMTNDISRKNLQSVHLYSFSDDLYGLSFNQISMLSGDDLHKLGYKGNGKVIAVLDNGFYKVDKLSAFDNLWANDQILGTWDFVEGESDVFDDGGHGTSVLSTMAAYLPGQIVGTAPEAKYWLLVSENNGSELIFEEDNWVVAAEFADSVGADIINSSLGYYLFDDTTMNHSYSDMDGNTTRVTIGADIAASKGILVVNSAGNEGQRPWKYIIAPADGDSVLAVAAVDYAGNHAYFSSYGPSYDGRIKPNVAAQGLGVIILGTDGNILYSAGTSFSSPIIAGMSACLWQAHPDMSNMEILDVIQKSAHQYNNPDTVLGYGIPNFLTAHLMLTDFEQDIFSSEPVLFPNPFTNYFFVFLNENNFQKIDMKVYDVLGRLVLAPELTVLTNAYNDLLVLSTCDLSFLQKGAYFVKINIDQTVYVRKTIKL